MKQIAKSSSSSDKNSEAQSEFHVATHLESENLGRKKAGRPKGKKNKKKKSVQKARARASGDRNEKNVFPNTLKRLYKAAAQDKALFNAINNGQFKNTIILTSKGEIKIQIKENVRVKKTEMMKFLYLLRKYIPEKRQRARLYQLFKKTVDDSIKRLERKHLDQHAINTKVMEEYELLQDILSFFLLDGKSAKEIRWKVFAAKKQTWNKGVRAIQLNKLKQSLEEFDNLLEERWDDVFIFESGDDINDSDPLEEQCQNIPIHK